MLAGQPILVRVFIVVLIFVGLATWHFCWVLHFMSAPQPYMHVPKSRVHTEVQYSADTLPEWDSRRLIDFENFKFDLSNTVCPENETLDLLVLVVSAPDHLERRNTIRETWAQPRKGMRLSFLLGAVYNQTIQDGLDAEDNKYHDLIQGNFKDDYKNLTYKYIMAFKYIVYFCPKVKYVLKTDDDIFVNIFAVWDYLGTLPKEGKKDLILCSLMDGSPAIREPSRWHVPFEEFPHSFYPIYCSGFAVIFSYDVVFRLYREGQRSEFFWVDDAHVTGTLAKRINLKHSTLPRLVMSGDDTSAFISSNGTKSPETFFYGPVNIQARRIRELWIALQGSKWVKKTSNSTAKN